ncbi:hypothetical protein KQX54_012522 [Cotesia glomerata]|uniref:SET domain-containing protein n=1 Tax=Cotesia glomerata TaxID=32391 RepID=A0AAV7IR98_COTGL|nr:hypothetical protein KQX54_012522 [Cotesia glomerata]
MENMEELRNYEYAVFIGKLLYHHTVLSSTNLCTWTVKPARVVVQSPYNHRCDPNMSYFVCLDMSIFITLQPIKKDEQLFIFYGQEFHHMPTSERRKELQDQRSYWCDCQACINVTIYILVKKYHWEEVFCMAPSNG